MQGITSYIITLSGCVLIFTLIIAVAPEGDIKKYLKLLLGLITAAIVLSPIAGNSIVNMLDTNIVINNVVSTGQDLEQLHRLQVSRLFSDKLSQELKNIIKQSYGITAKVEVIGKSDGTVESVVIEAGKQMDTSVISQSLGIPKDKIVFKLTKGE